MQRFLLQLVIFGWDSLSTSATTNPNTVEWRNDMSNEQWTKSMLKLNLNSAPDLNSIWNKQITSSSQPKRLMISKWVWSLIKNTFLSCFFEICKMLITRFKLNVFGLFREKVRWAFWNFNKIWIYKTQFQLSTIRDGWLLLWIFFHSCKEFFICQIHTKRFPSNVLNCKNC